MKRLILLCLMAALYLCGCKSFHEKNYEECLSKMEDARMMARKKEAYSYSHDEFNQCRRPARIMEDPDEQD
ncbi:MAG: hypothetical protein HQM12_10745 [SAR324 cluster bacterium]|nr:hypothetical protein [SAR324 cluster bacterium]MBF0350014.1 hypothetical protein [SAR324 cluster bacterium]